MADREQPYDPYIPSGGQGGQQGGQQPGNQRTAALQAVSPMKIPYTAPFGAPGEQQVAQNPKLEPPWIESRNPNSDLCISFIICLMHDAAVP